MDELPLQTLQCVLHRILEDIQDYTFQLADPDDDDDDDDDDNNDECWLRYMRWGIPSTGSASLVVIIQAPWILQDRDLITFTSLKEVRAADFAVTYFTHDSCVGSWHQL